MEWRGVLIYAVHVHSLQMHRKPQTDPVKDRIGPVGIEDQSGVIVIRSLPHGKGG